MYEIKLVNGLVVMEIFDMFTIPIVKVHDTNNYISILIQINF